MAKKQNNEPKSVADMQPDELNALKATVKEFINRVQNVDVEIETLKQDRKELIEEFQGKLDMKTLQLALKVIKIQASVQHRDAFDAFLEVLQDPAQ